MRVGLILAIETDAIFDYYKNPIKLEEHTSFNVWKIKENKNEILVLQTGLGEVLAAAGTQYLISVLKVDIVVNFGVVGGLTKEMKKAKSCVVDRIVHHQYDCSEFMPLSKAQVADHKEIYIRPDEALVEKATQIDPTLKRCVCCSGDKFIGKQEDKERLHELFNGDVCDMECVAIALICEQNKVPCLILKAVSDELAGGAGEFYAELKKVAIKCLQIADNIIDNLK